MKKIINSTLSEKKNSVAFLAKELLSDNAVIFNSIWSNDGYLSIIDYFKSGLNSGAISNNWFNKISETLKNKCGKYSKENIYSKMNAQTYLANLMLAGDGMGIINNEIKQYQKLIKVLTIIILFNILSFECDYIWANYKPSTSFMYNHVRSYI